MAQGIDRKLRLTAAVLGVVSRKDLAAQFRKINPTTSFDVDRAQKWLHGRSRPRERQIYEDWAKLLDLGRSGQWIADCEVETFLDSLCARHDCDRSALERQLLNGAGGVRKAAPTDVQSGFGVNLAGRFVSFSHAWSPYFRGQMICGELQIEVAPNQTKLVANYVQNLPNGIGRLRGPVTLSQRMLSVELWHPDSSEPFSMRLFRPTAPANVIVGYFSGVTYLSAETDLTVSRVVLIRIPPTCPRRTTGAYLPFDSSLAGELTTLGLPLKDPAEVDSRLTAFLMNGYDRGIDKMVIGEYGTLAELFDLNWFNKVADHDGAIGEPRLAVDLP